MVPANETMVLPSRTRRTNGFTRPDGGAVPITVRIDSGCPLIAARSGGAAVPHLGRPSPIDEFVLPNGLRVLLCPLPGKPDGERVGLVPGRVPERVARHHRGLALGRAHALPGSPRYTKGAIDRAIVSVGGTLNAFTDSDFTAYFSIVPREHLALPLDIEADRMTRALFAPEEVERERTVIYSEREGNENWPEFQAEEELYALAFRIHPYRWETLGHKEDIRNLTPDQLASYYRRFYGPKNAILVIAGGFDPGTTRDQVEEMFSPLPAEGDDPRVSAVEPAPRGERRGSCPGPGPPRSCGSAGGPRRSRTPRRPP